jgi:bifunctional DNase/RNase
VTRKKSPKVDCVDMTVSQLTVDPSTELPILILKDESGAEALPIWIGLPEANAIAAQLDQIAFERPLTHDLVKSILGEIGMKVDSVEVTDVRDHTFYAAIHLVGGGRTRRRRIKVDSRPSDAIALAIRFGAPIRVARHVLEQARHVDLQARPAPASESDAQESPDSGALAELLAGLADEDFGKWKM